MREKLYIYEREREKLYSDCKKHFCVDPTMSTIIGTLDICTSASCPSTTPERKPSSRIPQSHCSSGLYMKRLPPKRCSSSSTCAELRSMPALWRALRTQLE